MVHGDPRSRAACLGCLTADGYPIMIPDDDNANELPCGPCLAGDAPIHVVADTVSKVEGRVYPMAFVLPDGESRVLHTVFGRNARAHNEAVRVLMRRGCTWAAGVEPR